MLKELFKLPKLVHEVVYRLTGFVIIQSIDTEKGVVFFYMRNLWLSPFRECGHD